MREKMFLPGQGGVSGQHLYQDGVLMQGGADISGPQAKQEARIKSLRDQLSGAQQHFGSVQKQLAEAQAKVQQLEAALQAEEEPRTRTQACTQPCLSSDAVQADR